MFQNRKRVITIGVVCLLLILVQFCISLNQPVNNLGFTFEIKDNYYNVTKIVNNTEPSSFIQRGSKLKTINDVYASNLIELRKASTEQGFKKYCSDFFNFGQEITLIDTYGRKLTYTLHKTRLLQRLANISTFDFIQFVLALIIVINALVIVIFTNSNKTIYPLIYGLYFLGLTTSCLFSFEFASPVYAKLITVLMDIGLYCTFSCIFGYFSKIFEYSKYKNPFKYIKYIPLILLVIKYLHILVFRMDIIDNPFFPIDSIFVEICCGIIFILFFYVTIVFPKSLTVTFKFFVLGLTFAATPLIIDHISYLISGSLIMTEESKIFSIIAFIFIPFMLDLAIFQNRNIIRSRIATLIASHIAFPVIVMPCYFTFRVFLPANYKGMQSALSLFFAPMIYTLIHKLILKFFSYDSRDSKKLDSYKNRIEPITNINELHEITSDEINKMMNCTYVFLVKKERDGTWNEVYCQGEIDFDDKSQKIESSINRKRIIYYPDGSFSLPILRDNTQSGIIHVGPKKNGDLYLPGEHLYVEQLIKVFHKHYLLFTNNQLFEEIQEKNKKVQQMQQNIILSLANLIESRDGGTGAHVKRTGAYSALITELALQRGLYLSQIDTNFTKHIYKAAALHDVGKIVVPDAILQKPSKLTDDEYEIMKQHASEGERIVGQIFADYENEYLIEMTESIAKYHHEKWNGTGYPAGLSQEEIPLCARIVSIADAFDAIVSPRCYKPSKTPDEGFSIIQKDAGTHFDPILAQIFVDAKEQVLEILNDTQ